MNMKRQIVSPICSAFVIPGLGQILNYHLKKGIFLLCAVFILFIAGTVKLAFIINSLFSTETIFKLNKEIVLTELEREDLSGIYALIIIFGCLWVYSILDAFWYGKKIDKGTEIDLQ
jgi:hypothetical protein